MSSAIPHFPHSQITRDQRGVYTLQIIDAKSMNVLGTPVTQGLTEAAQWLAQQSDSRAVIIRGTGDKSFIGGANIFEMGGLDSAGAHAFITNLRKLCDAVRAIPVPTVARISGYCLGAGLEVAAACDIRLGSGQAQFGMPEVRVGIPSVIHALLLPALIGPGATNWLLLTGESVDGAQALQWGFLQFMTSTDKLDQLVEQTIAAIVASAPHAVRSQKALLRYWETASMEDGLDRSVASLAAAFDTEEPRKYMAPFLEKKKN
jgi:enoyl-CoA hydratase/carnithine racemase